MQLFNCKAPERNCPIPDVWRVRQKSMRQSMMQFSRRAVAIIMHGCTDTRQSQDDGRHGAAEGCGTSEAHGPRPPAKGSFHVKMPW